MIAKNRDEYKKEKLKGYLAHWGSNAVKKVRIGTHENLTPAECFIIYQFDCCLGVRVPFYISLAELFRIEGQYARVYGRTPWGPWCLISLKDFTIINVRRVSDPQNDARVKYLEAYFNNFEVK